MDDFYLTLPSATLNSTFKNSSSVYTTRLPQVLSLEKDKWVVAATDIIYPYSYKNVNRILKLFIHFKDARKPLCFNLPANQYKNAEQVLSILNANSRKRRNLKEAVDKDIAKKLVAALDKKAEEQENVFETIEKAISNSSTLAFLFTIIVLGNYDETEAPEDKDKKEKPASENDVSPAEVVKNNVGIDGNIDGNNVEHVDSTKILVTDKHNEETTVQEVTPSHVVENIDTNQIMNDAHEDTPPPMTKNSEKDENPENFGNGGDESFREALKKGLSESFDKHFSDLIRLHEMESDKRDTAIQDVLKNHTKFLETFQSVNNPTTLSNALSQLTERQAGMWEAISRQSNGVESSIAKSIEHAFGNQVISNSSANYKALIKEIDESKLDELSFLRNEMHPRTITFLSNLVQFDLEDDLLRIVFKDPEIDFVEFDKECAYFLGFHNSIVRNDELASSSIDFFGNISTLYVYCDIVDQTIVGNYKSSLLTVVPCKGNFGEMIQHTFPVPRYLPLMNSSIDSIKVSVLSEFGEPVQFNWGSTITTLHFKKIR